jgi:glycosyltransferase involved in cell wall biosynthesis
MTDKRTPRVLVVTPRVGRIAGGAEALLTTYARALHKAGRYHVEVATSCAVDHHTWKNELSAGTLIEDGIAIHRFGISVTGRERGRCPSAGNLTGELRWFGDSMWCPDLSEYLRLRARTFDTIIAGPYLFGTTIWTALEYPDKTILVPCLHDEPEAHTLIVGQMLRTCRPSIFNTQPEFDLARKLHGNTVEGTVVGIGLADAGKDSYEPELELPRNFVVYCGRMEQGKGAHLAAEAILDHNSRNPNESIDLVMIGGGPYEPPADPRIHVHGYVSESAKRSILRRARALISFSRMESLSIVLLEAWREGTPAIVGADCDVLRWQVERSGGGIVSGSPDEFSAALRELADGATRDGLAAGGAGLLRSDYSEGSVLERLEAAIGTT